MPSHGLRHQHNRSYDKDLLWREFFRDSSEWWDNRSTKASPLTPDFKHKFTKDSLWVDGLHNPSWVLQELRRRGPPELCLRRGGPTKENSTERAIHFLSIVNPQDNTDFLALLRACAKTKDLHGGTRVHADILKHGLLEKSSYVANTLV
eukprot:c23034_g8_i1 orf=134-580(+)